LIERNEKVFFPNLDGLRSVAFLLVFFRHGFFQAFNYLPVHSIWTDKIISLICNGEDGVSIFFVLSGFLITYLLLAEQKKYGKIHTVNFYIRRCLRIWPLYYVVITFVFFVYPYLKSLAGVATHIAVSRAYYYIFLSNFASIHIQKNSPGFDFMSGGITWSVAIEEQFYLLWPLLFTVVPKKFYAFIFYAVIIICLLFRFENRHDSITLYFHTLSVCGDLAIGGLCAYFSLNKLSFRLFFERLSRKSILLIYASGLAWLFFYDDIFQIDSLRAFVRIISTLFFAFIILEQNYSVHSFYKFSKIRLLSFWGKYTYGLYLLHPLVLTLLRDVFLEVKFKPSGFLSVFSVGIIALGISLTVSYLSYEYFEKRFLKLKEKFSFIRTEGVRD
jgi:peptidoglycan/LPS O-acetylase OafA/YrhL